MALSLARWLSYRTASVVPSVSSWRCYTQPVPHSRSTDDYKKFRKRVTSIRATILEDRAREKKMQSEDTTSQAAQEARMEIEREVKALEENEKELQRMASKREKRVERLAYKRELKQIAGAEVREKAAQLLKARRTERVNNVIKRSKDFVTLENLEQKIEEALANEVNYNFALSTSGQEIKKQ